MKRDPVLLALLGILLIFLAYKWVDYNPKADYCFIDDYQLYAHRPWAQNRKLAYSGDETVLISWAKNLNCPLELR